MKDAGSLIIRTLDDYERALDELRNLMAKDPQPDTPEGDHLHLLALLIEDYELHRFPVAKPDAVEAIRFRMEQLGLQQRDLTPILGSRARVSEVLARKRPLSVSMMRALRQALKIPAEVLLDHTVTPDTSEAEVEWDRFPTKEIVARGWIREGQIPNAEDSAAVMAEFLRPLGGIDVGRALYRRTRHLRSHRTIDPFALEAWNARVHIRALQSPPDSAFEFGRLGEEHLREIARLSRRADGPALVRDQLSEWGITFVVEPHLPRTSLDGACFVARDGYPVVAMTVRYDRIDNFWFTLMHELSHVMLHLRTDDQYFVDDLDVLEKNDVIEVEADRMALESLVPSGVWRRSRASRTKTSAAIFELSDELEVHPAIIAGRIRHETANYRILGGMVGIGEVRRHFPGESWPQTERDCK